MRTQILLAVAIVSIPLLVSARRPIAQEAEIEKVTLETHMEGFKTNLKAIAMGLGDPKKKDASVSAAIAFQDHAQAAKQFPPSNLREIDEGERAEHTLAYRKSMIALQRSLLDLEEKLLDDDAKGVMTMIRGELLAHRKAAHDEFQSDK